MQNVKVFVIGGGIGGLSSATALSQRGFTVDVIEQDAEWSVYGVGIIQQGNVLRAVNALGLLAQYVDAGVGFDAVEIYAPNGAKLARVPSPRLLPDYPANVGVSRRALQQVLADGARNAGASIRLGVTVDSLVDDGEGVSVRFSDASEERYDLVIGADGVYSQTRQMVFPEASGPAYTGQAVWRYNLPRPQDLDALHVYNGPIGAGLVPISQDLMYLYITTPEPSRPRFAEDQLAAEMRARMANCAPVIRELAEQITDNSEVVYRPLDVLLMEQPWHKGRVVLLGDAVHATTPHLGQGAGLAIEDGLVLAEEMATADRIEDALAAYFARRFDRCAAIVRSSLAICKGQLGEAPPVDNAKATAEMFALTAQPI